MGRWCILRTSGPRTVALVRALEKAGFTAWTPIARIKYPATAKRKEQVRENPIMPTFAFADEAHVIQLVNAAADPMSRLPAFSVFRRADRVPLIGERDMAALRAAETAADREYDEAIEAENREQRRLARVANLQSERARRKALRAEQCRYDVGTWIEVKDMPALAGLTGQVIKMRGNGTAAVICFGGAIEIEIEAWRLIPNSLAEVVLASRDRAGAGR